MTRRSWVGVLTVLSACTVVRPPPGGRQGSKNQGTSQPSAVDSLVAAGQELYDKGEYQAARSVWLEGLARARSEPNARVEARLLTSLGLTARQLGEYPEARRLGEAAITAERRHGLDSLLPRSYNLLGLLAWDQGRLSEAAELFRQTIAASRRVGDSTYVYRPSANLGLVYTQYGEFETARGHFLTALAGARDHQDTRTEGRVLTNLAVIALRTADVPAALGLLEEARMAAVAAGDAANEENILAQQTDAYSQLGEPVRAFATLDSALRRAQRQGAQQAIAADLELQASLYREAGDLRRALEIYQRARGIDDQLGLSEESGRDLRNEAAIHLRLGNPGLAERNALRALKVHQTVGARPAQLADLFLLAELAEMRGQSVAADHYLAVAREVVRSLNARSLRADAAVAEARILDRRRDNAGVQRVLRSVAADLGALSFTVEWEVHALQARAHARAGHLERAVAAGRRAVAAAERVRGNYGSEMLRTAFVAERRSAYSDLVAVLLRLDRASEAFEVADAARDGVLGDGERVAGVPAIRGLGAEQEATLRRIAHLAWSVNEAEKQGDSTAAGELAARLSDARRAFETAFVEQRERGGAIRRSANESRGASRIQAALRADETLIEYLIAEDRVFTFAVTPVDLRAFVTRVAAGELASRVRFARDVLADRHSAPAEADAALAQLHELLLGPARRSGVLQRARRLIVVPQGGLSYLPFSALRDAETGRYLLQDYSVLYLPSGAALPSVRGREQSSAATPAAVFAPLPGRLPASGIEAKVVGEALGTGLRYSGAKATEARLRASLASGGIVHLASHAVLSAQSPLFSRVALARTHGSDPEDDGQLELHEVLGLSVRSPLVFLSGCETDLGAAWSTAFAKGEDYATLARAFLYAGARNVVATLWPVEDEGAAAFAERFYRHLLDATPPAEAVATAQRDLLAGGQYQHPYYWAAYRVAGDGDLSLSQKRAPTSVTH